MTIGSGEDLWSLFGLKRPETMTQPCCGLVYPTGSREHLTEETCSAGYCTILRCQCGVQDVEWGPVFCPHKMREEQLYGYVMPVPAARGLARRYHSRRGKKYRKRYARWCR